ncbi:MAG TPA: TIGR00303 family protein [Chloroflexota bacterium]|nr:TIGR00303 family protein [Chloroflexota bacterium]
MVASPSHRPPRPPRPEPPALLYAHAARRARALAARLRGKRPLFICTIAQTDTARIPGLSAAGATPELRELTPAADAEALYYGSARCLHGVPANPLGPPGPAIITIAALRLARIPVLVVDAGTRVRPQAPAIRLGEVPGACLTGGQAVPDAAGLYQRGYLLGAQLAGCADYLVLGESVPGGTTTALAVLLALGLDAAGRVSSSMAANAHALKEATARQGLAHLDPAAVARDPLRAVAAVGDPMQAAVAGLALGACGRVPVLLAGGTQMAAVLALVHALRRAEGRPLDPRRVAIATTRWVLHDPTADLAGLVAQLGSYAVLGSGLSFAASRHAPLRRYEDFLVKEGVGAGGAAVAASLRVGASAERLRRTVERVYRALPRANGSP